MAWNLGDPQSFQIIAFLFTEKLERDLDIWIGRWVHISGWQKHGSELQITNQNREVEGKFELLLWHKRTFRLSILAETCLQRLSYIFSL